MKTSLFLFLSFFSLCSLATERQEVAKESVMTHAKQTFKHLKDNLQIDLTSLKEVKNKVYIDLSIGTKRRPSSINSCFIVTFDNNGFDYISNLEHRWDESCL